jgi:hypothetical protein
MVNAPKHQARKWGITAADREPSEKLRNRLIAASFGTSLLPAVRLF